MAYQIAKFGCYIHHVPSFYSIVLPKRKPYREVFRYSSRISLEFFISLKSDNILQKLNISNVISVYLSVGPLLRLKKKFVCTREGLHET